jgi:hypothetical protein
LNVKNLQVHRELAQALSANSDQDVPDAVAIQDFQNFYLLEQLRNYDLAKLKFLYKLKHS